MLITCISDIVFLIILPRSPNRFRLGHHRPSAETLSFQNVAVDLLDRAKVWRLIIVIGQDSSIRKRVASWRGAKA